MHVASLVFVGGGGCENLTEKLAVGLLDSRQGAHPREPRTTAYAKTSCWSVLWDVPCTSKRGIGTYSRLHQGSLVPVRWWSQDSLPKGLKLTKVIIQHARKKLGT